MPDASAQTTAIVAVAAADAQETNSAPDRHDTATRPLTHAERRETRELAWKIEQAARIGGCFETGLALSRIGRGNAMQVSDASGVGLVKTDKALDLLADLGWAEVVEDRGEGRSVYGMTADAARFAAGFEVLLAARAEGGSPCN